MAARTTGICLGWVLSLGSIVALVAATLVGVAGAAGAAPSTVPVSDNAYWLAAADGAVYNFGGAASYGSMYGKPLNAPIVGMAATPTGKGYWEVASDGGIFTFGTAEFFGSMGGKHLNAPIVGMAATPTGKGYWEVASDGGIFTFGTAEFFGSMGGKHLNAPIVGMAATPTGKGYWEVASDGGIFTFGTAQFQGSMGGTRLNDPITGMTPASTGKGYWEVASDGGIFTFGTAQFQGSMGSDRPPGPVVGMSPTFTGGGYWLTSATGTVSNFGSAENWGSASQVMSPVVAIATTTGTGQKTTPPVYGGGPAASYASGSYGFDVSSYTCNNLPPAPHAIGVVQVAGASFAPLNPCFNKEVAWAGSGLTLYLYLTHGTSVTAEPGCSGNPTAPTSAACNFGYAAGMHAYAMAHAAIGPLANVTWWLDIEEGDWTATTSVNRSTVVGAYDALRAAGPASVGFYFSISNWNDIVGNYNPIGAPLFPAWWSGPPPQYKCVNARAVAASNHDVIPSGPIAVVQYASSSTRDYDYAC
jgi:hypothetical protein